MAFFLYSNCDICLKYDRLTVIKYIEKNFNRPKKKIVCENNLKKIIILQGSKSDVN